MADRHRARVAFVLVYIREAHPEEGWILPENRRSGVAVHEPATVAERVDVASLCAAKLHVNIKVVTIVVRRRPGLNSSAMLGRLSVPAWRFFIHAGDSGKNGRITISGNAGIKPDIKRYRQSA